MWLWDMWGVLWAVEAVAQLVAVLATPLDPAPPIPQGETQCPAYAESCYLADYLSQNLPNFCYERIEKSVVEWKTWLCKINVKNKWHHMESPIIWKEMLMKGSKPFYIGGASEFLDYCYSYYNFDSLFASEKFDELLSNVLQFKKKVNAENLLIKQLEAKSNVEEETTIKTHFVITITGAGHILAMHLISQLLDHKVAEGERFIHKVYIYDSSCSETFMKFVEKECYYVQTNYPGKVVKYVEKIGVALTNTDLLIVLDHEPYNEHLAIGDWLHLNRSKMKELALMINASASRKMYVVIPNLGPACYNATILRSRVNINKKNIAVATSDLGLEILPILAEIAKIPMRNIFCPPVWGFVGINHIVDVRTTVHKYNSFEPFSRYTKVRNSSLNIGSITPKMRTLDYLMHFDTTLWQKVADMKRKYSRVITRINKAISVVQLVNLWLLNPNPDHVVNLGIYCDGLSLSPFVRHWQPAAYAQLGGRRHSRAALPPPEPPPPPLRLTFHAHNREFKLILRPDPSSVFAEGVQFHSTGGQMDYNTAHVYSGKLEDDESSHVYGVITADGLFDGTIWTPTEEYYVEPISRYNIDHPSMHSVIYRRSDVEHPYDTSEGAPCASHLLHMKRTSGQEVELFNFTDQRNIKGSTPNNISDDLRSEIHRRKKRWLPEDEMQDDEPKKNPELPLDLDVPYSNSEPSDKLSTRKPKTKIDKSNLITKVRLDSEESRPKPKTHVEVIKTKAGVVTVSKDIVKKEPVGYTVLSANASDDGRHVNKRATVDPRKTTCLVYLQADHMFYQRYGSEEACIEVMTRHVQKVNAIYKVTDFNQDGKPDNITFMIKRIKVHTLDALKDPAYRFPNNYGVEKYLELFSEEDYDAFCLAYMFTYRDFEMGTLGLAWTGDLKNAGGVCEKNGHYRGSMKSLNTGIVTLLNYGKHVPPAVSHVTLAHEIGHNFGSPHDPEVCTPFGEDGNYIMFARATSGDRKNNNKFSPCSLRAIDPVLNNKARSPKGCFTEPQPAICGNGVVEEGEECDCGWASECTDVCCRPQAARPHYKPCTLTEHSVCSPSQGPCCTASCTLKFGDKCRSDNGCRDAAFCDGKRAGCPASRHKPNRTRCDKELVCYMGECTGSICLAYGLESCQCGARGGDPRSACELCCRAPAGPCLSSFTWNTPPFDVPDMYAKPGTPCNDYNGYCDVFQRCREVDPSGPLATLRKLLLSDESIAGFKRWVLKHWYAVLLILLAVIALLVASTRFLGRHGKKLKSVTIIHSSTTETVRLPDAADQGLIVHTAVRSKLPLKKKVALRTRAYRNKKDHKKLGDKASPLHNANKKRKPISQAKLEEAPKITKESTAIVTNAEGKSPKHVILSKHKGKVKKRKTKMKKETIDYSSMQKHPVSPIKDTEALSKVQRWLLSSPQPTAIPKSKSIPLGLTERTHRQVQKSVRKTRPSKSATNLLSGEKARLQVVFKPPFRFSVKICKSDKTKVVLDKSSKPDMDRKRHEVVPQQASAEVTKANLSGKVPKHSNSTRTPENPATASAPKLEKLQIQEYQSHGYANLLPRSASDCKLTKKLPEVRIRNGHKKSNSVGQKKETTESRQNLITQEDCDNAHVYENVVISQDAFVPKSCSMPRRQASVGMSRQSSYGHLPRAQIRPHRHSTNNISRSRNNSTSELEHFYNVIESLRRNNTNDVNTCNTNTSSSSGSSRHDSALLKHSSSSRQVSRTSRQNSLVDKPARSSPTDSCKLQRQHSEVELVKPHGDGGLKGFQLVVGKDKLKRQLSDNELCKSRVQLAMPMSAGAEPRQAFCWNKRASLDCEASLPAGPRVASARNKKRTTYTFGELKNTVPNATDTLPAEDVHISPEEFLNIIDN